MILPSTLFSRILTSESPNLELIGCISIRQHTSAYVRERERERETRILTSESPNLELIGCVKALLRLC